MEIHVIFSFQSSHKHFLHRKKWNNRLDFENLISRYGIQMQSVYRSSERFYSPVSTVLWSSHKMISTRWEEWSQSFVVVDFPSVSTFVKTWLIGFAEKFFNSHEGHKQIGKISFKISFFVFFLPTKRPISLKAIYATFFLFSAQKYRCKSSILYTKDAVCAGANFTHASFSPLYYNDAFQKYPGLIYEVSDVLLMTRGLSIL